MTLAKVELGRRLFDDIRLSGSGTWSCASCHDPDRAFTDGRARAVGSTGQQTRHGSTSLLNSAYGASFGWVDGGPTTLEAQIEIALFNTRPVELGLTGHEARVRADLESDPVMRRAFASAFPAEEDAVSLENATKALAAYTRTLIAGTSAYDRLLYRDDQEALSDPALRGMRLFHSPELGCSACHAGFNFSGPVKYVGGDGIPVFHRTLTTEDGEVFRAPTLRNVAITAPYMHDGRFATLPEVIRHYAAGPRHTTGVADDNKALTGFALKQTDLADLVAFLESLTDEAYTTRPARSGRQNRKASPASASP